MRPERFLVDPVKEPESVTQAIESLTRVLEGNVDFGHPQDPDERNLGSTTLAGSAAAAHPGTIQNVRGSWVEVEVTAADTPQRCFHNLDIPVITGEPNVRWLLFGYEHDGNTTNAASTVSCNFETGQAIAATYIDLSFYVGGTRVVNGAHPLKATLFFIPAVR